MIFDNKFFKNIKKEIFFHMFIHIQHSVHSNNFSPQFSFLITIDFDMFKYRNSKNCSWSLILNLCSSIYDPKYPILIPQALIRNTQSLNLHSWFIILYPHRHAKSWNPSAAVRLLGSFCMSVSSVLNTQFFFHVPQSPILNLQS